MVRSIHHRPEEEVPRKRGRPRRSHPPVIPPPSDVWVVCELCDLAMDSSLMSEHRDNTGHKAFAGLEVAREEGWLPIIVD